jgi:AcrR family transcriptional regulator
VVRRIVGCGRIFEGLALVKGGFAWVRVERPEALQRRESIMRAAAEVFERVGYIASSLEQIAGRAQVSKSGMTYYFPAKIDLARAVIDAQMASSRQLREHSAQWDCTALDRLGRVAESLAVSLRESPIARGAMQLAAEYQHIDPGLPQPFDEWIEWVAQVLAIGQHDRSVRPDVDVAATARTIVASFFGIQEVSARQCARADLAERTEEWWETTRAGLAIAKVRTRTRDRAS